MTPAPGFGNYRPRGRCGTRSARPQWMHSSRVSPTNWRRSAMQRRIGSSS
jgi:hypothetical protein